jgi:hypothetical protein
MPGEEANALIGREQYSPFVKRSRFPVITSQNKVSFPLQPYRIVTYRSIFFCVEVISSTLVVRKQRNTLRFATIRLKWKTLGASFHLKASFHSGNYPWIGTDKNIFLCLVSSGLELMTLTERKMFLPVPIHG